MTKFTSENLKMLWKPNGGSKKGENGSITIIGGSQLFHGAPIFAIKAASRLTDMVFFSSPDKDLEQISAKAYTGAFIWVPWEEIEKYVVKSDAVLIGPGMMRYESGRVEEWKSVSEIYDGDGTLTRSVTKYFLQKYPDKKWVIDGGSLQVMEKEWIPKKAILTCNTKEFETLFSVQCTVDNVQKLAEKYHCVVEGKGVVTYVSDGETIYMIEGGNAGLTKGGTGDVQAGLTAGLLVKNEPLLAAATAAFVVKKTAEELAKKVGMNFNADDVGNEVFATLHNLIGD